VNRGAAFAVALCGALVLSACATGWERRAEGVWLSERSAFLAQQTHWGVSGRLALSDGRRGGSLSFAWKSTDQQHRVELWAPTGAKRWTLTFSPDQALLTGSDIGRRSGPSPDPLVEQAVGWPIPVEELSWWLRALIPPGRGHDLEFAENGVLARAQSPPWLIEFQRFELIEDVLLPSRLQIESPPYRVRLVLRDWTFALQP